MNGAGGVRSGGRVGGGCGNSDGAGWIGVGSIGGSQLCGSGFLGRVMGVLRWWWHWRVFRLVSREGEEVFLGRFSLISVAGNTLPAVGACLLGMVIRWAFLEFLDFFYFLEWMEEVVVWV